MLSVTARASEVGRTMTARGRWATATATAVAVVSVASACSGGHTTTTPGQPQTTPSTTGARPAASAPSAPADAARQKVIDAYDAMWADMVNAARTADYRSSALGDHTVDPATGQLRRTLLTYSRLGIVVKGTLRTHPRVTSLDRSTAEATVADCLDDTHWLTYDAKTGRPTDNSPGGRTATDATLRQVNGRWLVSSYVIHRGQSC